MALGKRRNEQQEMWVATTSLPKSEGHVFYRKLNQLLAEVDFDSRLEKRIRTPAPSDAGHRRRGGQPSQRAARRRRAASNCLRSALSRRSSTRYWRIASG